MKLEIKGEIEETATLYLLQGTSGVCLMADTPQAQGLKIANIYPNGLMEVVGANSIVTRVTNGK